MKKKNITGVAVFLSAAVMLLGSAAFAPARATDDAKAGYDVPVKAHGVFLDTQGREVGTASLNEDDAGTLIRVELHDLPPGEHAIHIHEKGDCTPVGEGEGLEPAAYFSNAGSHLNPAKESHGFLHDHGPHPGDLPNLFADEAGNAKIHAFNDKVTVSAVEDAGDRAVLLDEDGAAIIIHAAADDYESQPTGQAGDRIACAVILAE